MSASPRLDTLPFHILTEIISLVFNPSYELPVWRLRAVCHTFREAADSVLRPALARVDVTFEQALGHYFLVPVDEDYAKEDRAQSSAEIRRVNDIFARHLVAYRAARSDIKHLTAEVRTDDWTTGWTLLKDHAGTITTLELHLWDALWLLELNGDPEDEGASDWAVAGASETWNTVLDHGAVQLSCLTSLTLVTCARIVDHLAGILPSTPNLLDLTVACHWNTRLFDYEPMIFTEYGISPPANLERLTVYGDEYNVEHVLQNILPGSPKLHKLIVNISELASTPDYQAILEIMSEHTPLQCLALLGTNSPNSMNTLSRIQEENGPAFPNLTTLVVEERYWDGDGDPFKPLLDNCEADRPDFPALYSFTIVDHYVDRWYRSSSYSPPPDERYHNLYDGDALRSLAKRYPTLGKVRWLAGHPEDPFDANQPLPHDYHHQKCKVEWEPGTIPPTSFSETIPTDYNDPRYAHLM